MIRRGKHDLRELVCDGCGSTLHLDANGDAFDIGRAVTADGWTFGARDTCRSCDGDELARLRARRRTRTA